MKIIFTALTSLVSLFHFYFFILESFLWTHPKGMRVFNQSLARAEATKVLAYNQGFYNALLAAGLLYGLVMQDVSITIFCLVSVVIAGIVGALSVNQKIFFVQALPAILALIAFFIMTKTQGSV